MRNEENRKREGRAAIVIATTRTRTRTSITTKGTHMNISALAWNGNGEETRCWTLVFGDYYESGDLYLQVERNNTLRGEGRGGESETCATQQAILKYTCLSTHQKQRLSRKGRIRNNRKSELL